MKNRLMATLAGIIVMLTGALSISSPALAATTYHYAVGQQTGLVADGAAVNLTVETPYMNSAHDGSSSHSLAELLVRDTSGANRIEVGWRKPVSSATALFVYHRVNGVPQGYNLCTDNAAVSLNAGAPIPAGDVGTGVGKRFQILHSGSAWWIAYQQQWICHFPDTVWTSQGVTFNKVNIVQAYGETAATATTTPCMDMGNGQAASSSTAARIGSYTLQNEASAIAPAFTVFASPAGVGITTSVTTSTLFSYGWAGYTSANTLPGNVGSC